MAVAQTVATAAMTYLATKAVDHAAHAARRFSFYRGGKFERANC